MADIILPATLKAAARVEWGYDPNSWALRSPTTRQMQTVGYPGSAWSMRAVFPVRVGMQARLLEVLRVQLRGSQNRLVCHRLDRPALLGLGGGTPVVNGSGQTGASISISGLVANRQGVYQPGDMIGIGGELKMVTAVVNANASGVATVTFEPPLRASPAAASAIVTDKPTTRWVLVSERQRWIVTPGGYQEAHELDLVESFT